MFNITGKKIRIFAIILFAFLTAASLLGGIIMIGIGSDLHSDDLFECGILTLLFGWIIAWIVVIPLLAFAELMQDVAAIREKLCGPTRGAAPVHTPLTDNAAFWNNRGK